MADNSLKKGRYTKYSNKIGLYSNSKGSFVNNDTDVVLSFPFKDAVLEAGMSKEDVGREERFLQVEIDSKDIDTLEEPKVLTDFRFIDKAGERTLNTGDDIEFFDGEGELKQNLLIKGNNLLALFTLKARLAGKVKLIYIDPPYNTGSDGFRYNDSFNHSAWLTFMKNRLEVAKSLLREDGLIFIQCDDNEQAYLTILMDEIFGRDNRINTIAVNMSTVSGNKIKHTIDGKRFPKTKEYILLYALDRTKTKLTVPKSHKEKWDSEYNKIIPDWTQEDYSLMEDGDIDAIRQRIGELHLVSLTDYAKENNIELTEEWKWDNAYRIFAVEQNESLRKIARQQDLQGDIACVQSSRGLLRLISTNFNRESTRARIELVSAQEKGQVFLSDNWTDMAIGGGISYEGSVQMQNGKKPEKLIQRILSTGSSEGDIVLDFCLGSGTTAAVAHKMNRRWVGIEQMDYIETLAKVRLSGVVQGEQTGISKPIGWQGGGSFVYFELKKYNQEYIDRIMEATSLSELEDLYVDMRNNAFLKFWFDRSEFEKDEGFRKLDIDGRKQALADVLDENQLYLNYADMGDTRHKVTADEKALTDKFYGSNEN